MPLGASINRSAEDGPAIEETPLLAAGVARPRPLQKQSRSSSWGTCLSPARAVEEHIGLEHPAVKVDLGQGKLIKTARNSYDPVPRRVALTALLVYFVIGQAFFGLRRNSLTPDEPSKTAFLDTLLFNVVTLTTVGYGEEVPDTEAGHIFGALYALTGVAIVGYSFGIVFDELYNIGDTNAEHEDEIDFTKLVHPPSAIEQGWRDDCRAFLKSFAALVVVLVTGTLLMYIDGGTGGDPAKGGIGPDGATLVQSFYFACITVTTIGYGDYMVKTVAGKIVLILYLVVSTSLFAHFVTLVASMPLNRRQRRLEDHIMSQFGRELDMDELASLTKGGLVEGEVSKPEFILRMLVWLGRANVTDIAMCGIKFDDMDKDHSGTLDLHDIRNLSAGNRWKAAIHAVRMTGRIRKIKSAALGLPPPDATEAATDAATEGMRGEAGRAGGNCSGPPSH